MRGIVVCGVFLLTVAGIPEWIHAQEAVRARQNQLPLQIEIAASSFNSRTDAPIPLLLMMQWEGEKLLEGQLELEFRDSANELLQTLHIDDFFVSPGEQLYPLLVPSLPYGADEQIEILATLRKDGRSFQLLPMTLRVPGLLKRTMVIGVGLPEIQVQSEEINDWSDWLHLANTQPDPPNVRGANRNVSFISTLNDNTAVEDYPVDPHWLCTRDIVLLPPEGLAKLEATRLDALLAWVRAGGSLCVLVDDKIRLTEPIVSRLNQLLTEHAAPPLIVLDGNGKLVGEIEDLPVHQPLLCHFGLGRFVLGRVLNTSRPNLKEIGWRDAAAFLWKFRKLQAEAMRYEGKWTFTGVPFSPGIKYGRMNYAGMNFGAAQFLPQRIGGWDGLLEKMLPRGIQVFPLWLLMVMGATYILAVGPLDYWLLGRINQRKLTWVLFPALTFGFLAVTLAISRLYIQSSDHVGVVIFKDVTAGGLVARETELQLQFGSSNREVETLASRCLLSAMNFHDLGTSGRRMMRGIRAARDLEGLTTTVYRGRMPTEVTAVQALPQWTPQLNRLTRIPRQPQRDESGFDWDAPIDIDSAAGHAALRQRLITTFGTNVNAVVYRSSAKVSRLRGGEILATMNPSVPAHYLIIAGPHPLIPAAGDDASPQRYYRSPDAEFCMPATVRNGGIHSLVSQLSPMGGHDLEDLTLLDPDDWQSVVLMVADQKEDQLTIYRKVYRSEKPAPPIDAISTPQLPRALSPSIPDRIRRARPPRPELER